MYRLIPCIASLVLLGCASPPDRTLAEPVRLSTSATLSITATIPGNAGPEDLVRLALARNPSLRALQARADRLAQKPPQDATLPDPMVEVAALGSMAETAAGRMEAMGGIKQKVPFPGKRREAAAASTREAEAALRDLEAMRLKVVEQVRSAWWDYYLSSESDRITRESRELLDAMIQSADARVAAGTGNQSDQLRLANEATQLDRDLADARRMTGTARARLNSLLDRDAGASLPAARTAALPGTGTLDSLLARATERHPEIQAASLRNQAYQHRLARAELEKFPDLTLGIAGASISSSGLSRMSNGRDQIYGTLGFNIPLWQEPRKAMIREAEAGLRETEALVGATRADLRYRIEDAWNRATAAREIIGLFESRLVPDADQAHQVALATYTADQAPFNDLIDTWRSLLTYKLQLAAARSQLGKADAALRAAAALDSFNQPK
ncbi:TolC family protein [Haloferula sargassicola]|uniref:TolC family protein n=1 Tax=Haloferula sargassicola TaxID=490096 RepID=A0ABP9UV81_9BACT